MKMPGQQSTLARSLGKMAALELDISVGDTLLGGKFKNVPTVVKEIGTDELGQPTVNGKKLLSFRIKKTMPAKTKATDFSFSADTDYEEKTANLRTDLKPHQLRVVAKALKNNLLVAHGTGSGKTLASIAAADAIGAPVDVVVPASLVGNYQKELKNHLTPSSASKFQVNSIDTLASRGTPIRRGATTILDETHNLRNEDSARHNYVADSAARMGRLIALSATPAYNQVSDIAPIMNLLHGKKVLPTGYEFDKHFVEETPHSPGLWGLLTGITPGNTYALKNENRLREVFKNYVDVHNETEGFPDVNYKDITVPMDPKQQEFYDYIRDHNPSWLDYKITNSLPPSKRESKDLNSFLVGLRQAGVSSAPYRSDVSPLDSARESTKLTRAADEIAKRLKKDPKFRGFTYTNWMEAGALPFKELLDSKGISSEIYHGGLTPKQKSELAARYNEGKLPVLIGSSSAAEGLDLKGTRLMQVLDSHFNESKIRQAIGRAARYKSHDALPEDQRNVEVQRYFSRPVNKSWFGLVKNEVPGVDEWMRDQAVNKQKLIDRLVELMTEESEKTSAYSPVSDLLEAKAESDARNFKKKHAIVRLLMKAKPDDFQLEEAKNGIVGFTHTPSGFRMHVPQNVIPLKENNMSVAREMGKMAAGKVIEPPRNPKTDKIEWPKDVKFNADGTINEGGISGALSRLGKLFSSSVPAAENTVMGRRNAALDATMKPKLRYKD